MDDIALLQYLTDHFSRRSHNHRLALTFLRGRNKVSMEVVRLENRPGGAKFEDVRDLVSGARGKTVYETGDIDAGIWSAGITVGLIHDIVSACLTVPFLRSTLGRRY